MSEVARGLADLAAPRPVHLFVSGAAAPDLYVTTSVFLLGDDKLVDVLDVIDHPRAAELRQNSRLRREMLPAIRSDFEMMAAYRASEPVALDVPITVLRAQKDLWTYFHGAAGWARYTTAAFELATIEDADHFHVLKDPTTVSDVVSSALGWDDVVANDANNNGESSSRIKLSHQDRLPQASGKKRLTK